MVQAPSCKCAHDLSVGKRLQLFDINILICWIFYEFFEKGKYTYARKLKVSDFC